MKDISDRAFKLAQESSLESIKFNIQEWQEELDRIKIKIKELEKSGKRALDMFQFWTTALIYKKQRKL